MYKMWTVLLIFSIIFAAVVNFTIGQTFEEFALASLTAIEREQQALTSDINRRLQQEHDAYENLLKTIDVKQKQLQDSLYNISIDTLLELQHVMRSPLTSLQLFVDQDIQKQQTATEAEYLQLLIDVKTALRENKSKCGYKAIDLHSRSNNLVFTLAFIALQKPEFNMPVYTCDVVKTLPNDCAGVVPFNSGIKPLRILNATTEMLCDNEQEGGGWNVLLKRYNGREVFHNRTKEEYMFGFGHFCQEFFVGIRTIQMLLGQNITYILRVEVSDFHNKTAVAHYDGIRFMNVDWANATTHHLEWLGSYSGNAGDALSSAVGSDLTIPHRLCNIFGLYSTAGTPADEHHMMWSTFSKETLKSITLMVRLQHLGVPAVTG